MERFLFHSVSKSDLTSRVRSELRSHAFRTLAVSIFNPRVTATAVALIPHCTIVYRTFFANHNGITSQKQKPLKSGGLQHKIFRRHHRLRSGPDMRSTTA